MENSPRKIAESMEILRAIHWLLLVGAILEIHYFINHHIISLQWSIQIRLIVNALKSGIK